jgi:hypothetical protein
MKKVITFNGQLAERGQCKKIKNKYYVKNKDCFLINDVWYRIDSGLIGLNHTTQKWELLSTLTKTCIKGVVGVNNDVLVFGYFESNPYDNVIVAADIIGSGRTHTCINSTVLLGSSYIEVVSLGVYSIIPRHKAAAILNQIDHKENGYNIEDNQDEMLLKTELFNNYKSDIPKNIYHVSKFIKGYRFGAELEAAAGYMPRNLQNRTGVVICRDGSLHGGPEYTTIPLSGAKGIKALLDIAEYMAPRHVINQDCSYHLHISGMPTSRTYIVALYRLSRMIQDDVFKMFPKYKTEYKIVKDKDYNKKLKSLQISNYTGETTFQEYVNENYYSIFTFLSNGVFPCDKYNRTNKNHPQPQKWNRINRYYWINFMNLFFSNRDTVEFRLHHGTMNAYKIINWLFMCVAMVKYAEIHMSELLIQDRVVTIIDVLSIYGTSYGKGGINLSNYLINYYKERVATFANGADSDGQEEYMRDHLYKYQSKDSLYNFIF